MVTLITETVQRSTWVQKRMRGLPKKSLPRIIILLF